MKFAPIEIFKQILEWSVIPTFDLVVEYGNEGIILVKRKVAPYKNQWALPGLRMYKEESMEDTLKRIAKQEVGLIIDPKDRIFLGQYVGKFKTENQRQDLSTGYLIKIKDNQKIKPNTDHFSELKITKTLPKLVGSMYKFYFEQYLMIKSK